MSDTATIRADLIFGSIKFIPGRFVLMDDGYAQMFWVERYDRNGVLISREECDTGARLIPGGVA